MTRRCVRKPTCWHESEWAHVAGEARRAAIPALRFVREAALGIRAPKRFTGQSHGRVSPSRPGRERPSDDVVLALADMLASLRVLATACLPAPTAAAAVEAAILRAERLKPARLHELRWFVLPTAATLSTLARLASGPGDAPPAAVLDPLLTTICAMLGACR